MTRIILIVIGLCNILSCVPSNEQTSETSEKSIRPKAKFEPGEGKILLFVGQELEAIGGLEEYNDGYLDHFEAPGGFTMYTNFSPGDSAFSSLKGNEGVMTTDDWGDGPSNMSLQVADRDFKDMALAIGLAFVGHDEAVANGERDSLMFALGGWIKSLGQRPVFLRIGYEFLGEWNGYKRNHYLKAYRRIKDTYDSLGINNIAYVWQSHGWEEPIDTLEAWYPGDEYVDWCAYSFFNRYAEANMIEFARSKGKPVFIAEATPVISGPTVMEDGNGVETILSNDVQAEEAWDKWFTPFFKTIDSNSDVIKAIHYINANWRSRPMWKTNPLFDEADSRLHTSEIISRRWKEEISKDKYLHSSPDLFDRLWDSN